MGIDSTDEMIMLASEGTKDLGLSSHNPSILPRAPINIHSSTDRAEKRYGSLNK